MAGELKVKTEEVQESKKDKFENENKHKCRSWMDSSTRDERRRQAGLSRTQRGKSNRRVIAMSANCALSADRCDPGRRAFRHRGEDEAGPTLLQLHTHLNEVAPAFHSHLRH